jgi:NADPH-dependent glutamate synthase beta subunit-like oxidoreductase
LTSVKECRRASGDVAGVSYRVTIPDEGYFRELVKCQSACPVGTDARGYVRAIAEGDYEKAYLIARGPNPLASICGRVCGAPCEAACRRGALDRPVSIRALKRTATERFGSESGRFEPLAILERVLGLPAAEHACEGGEELRSLRERMGLLGPGEKRGERARCVAIIGSGPAGLACAHDLALLGHAVTVLECEREPAGMLIWGIPEYRLPRDLIRAEVEVIRRLGVEFRCSTRVGVDVGFDQLTRDFESVVIAVGAKNSRKLRLPGVDGPGVLGGVEFLREVALGERPTGLGERVVVIGGGNVAYDVARTAVRQVGLDVSRTALRQAAVRSVTLVSLESLEEMPADDAEILEGDEEGVQRLNSLGPVRVERDAEGRVTGVLFKRCKRVFDEQKRFAPLFDDEDTTLVPCDTVAFSVGQALDLSFLNPARDGVQLNERGNVLLADVDGPSTRADVFVAGDAAYGPKLLIHAVKSGKRVARAVHRRLTGIDVAPESVGLHRVLEGYRREPDYEKFARVELPTTPVAERLRSQGVQVERVLDDAVARREAARCFDCGVNPIFDGAKCVLCGGCVEVCPESCLKIVALERIEPSSLLARLRNAVFGGYDGPVSAILKDDELCIRCALCAERCPNSAITMERFCFKTVTK